MAQRKYWPDYDRLYPGAEISPEVLAELKKSDRKMKYMEYDIKAETPIKDKDGAVIVLLPGREDSYERLRKNDAQFISDAPMPDEFIAALEEIGILYQCLDKLNEDDRKLIDALFFENNGQGVSESALAKRYGISQQAVSKRLRKIIRNLKKYF